LDGFDDEQIQTVCTQSNSLQNFATNQNLKPLLKSPFFANLAYRVFATGTEFGPSEGEKEFRASVWRDVISKEQDRKNGMPIKRKQAFIRIAVRV
jgi:hypothetical protein